MKITLINPNRHTGYPKPPLGLLAIGSVCKKAGHDVTILDADLLDLSPQNTALRAQSADIIGLTAMTPTANEAIAISESIKKLSCSPVILGGIHATIYTDKLTRYFDSVVCGEGESAILNVLADIRNKGLQAVYLPAPVDYPALDYPDYSLLDVPAYKPRYPHGIRTPWISLQTSRGCPFNCTFCCNKLFGRQYRAMPARKVGALLSSLVGQYGMKDLTFYDDEFTLDKTRVHTICEYIIERKFDLTWTCEARVDLIDQNLLEHMAAAGCRLICYGIESGNQAILDSLRKGITLDQIKTAVHITNQAGIQAAGYFMLGCPGETCGTMHETVDFARSLKLGHAQFSACSPLPGSVLYEQSGNNHDWSQYQYLSRLPKILFTSSALSESDIENAVEAANAEYNQKSI